MPSRRLNEANDKGNAAEEALGEVHEDVQKFPERSETNKAPMPSLILTVPLLGVRPHLF